MAYERAVTAGLEAMLASIHSHLDRVAVASSVNGSSTSGAWIRRELSAAERVCLAVDELETLRRRVALLTHVERTPQLDDENL
jgi:uncharacterized membrane-anchored protein